MPVEVLVRVVDIEEGRIRQFFLEIAALSLERSFVEIPFPLSGRDKLNVPGDITDVGREVVEAVARDPATVGRVTQVTLTDRGWLEVQVGHDGDWPAVMPAVKDGLELLTSGEEVQYVFTTRKLQPL